MSRDLLHGAIQQALTWGTKNKVSLYHSDSVLMTLCLLRAPVFCLPLVLSQRKVIIVFSSLHVEISVPPSPTYEGNIFTFNILPVSKNK